MIYLFCGKHLTKSKSQHTCPQINKHNLQLWYFPQISVEWKPKFCSVSVCQICTIFSCAFIYEPWFYLLKNIFITLLFRCVVLSDPLKDSSRSQESWNAFLTKLRTLLLMSFTKNLGKFEDDMRTLREKRTEPGWSFCEYFMVQVRFSLYWEEYLSPNYDKGFVVVVVIGFLVLWMSCSFSECWGREYEDLCKSSILRSCSQQVCVTLSYSAVTKAESKFYGAPLKQKKIPSRKSFSSCSWILDNCPSTVPAIPVLVLQLMPSQCKQRGKKILLLWEISLQFLGFGCFAGLFFFFLNINFLIDV